MRADDEADNEKCSPTDGSGTGELSDMFRNKTVIGKKDSLLSMVSVNTKLVRWAISLFGYLKGYLHEKRDVNGTGGDGIPL